LLSKIRPRNLIDGTNMGWMSFKTEDGGRVYPEVSGLAAWRKNCKWYSPLR
jgi:hypothetical protein